jgi:hypothetical protein
MGWLRKSRWVFEGQTRQAGEPGVLLRHGERIRLITSNQPARIPEPRRVTLQPSPIIGSVLRPVSERSTAETSTAGSETVHHGLFKVFLDRDTIVRAFDLLNERLAALQQRAEIFLVGGAVMCLVYNARPATKDVDGWFTAPAAVRAAAKSVADELGLAEDWLNDAAKAYVPQNAGYETWQVLSHLTIAVVDAPTLLAMKCAAARTPEDAGDIRILAGLLELRSSKAILDVVGRYLPEERLPVRTRLLLEEMFDDGE